MDELLPPHQAGSVGMLSLALCYGLWAAIAGASPQNGIRRARPANNSFTKFEFNQAWLAES